MSRCNSAICGGVLVFLTYVDISNAADVNPYQDYGIKQPGDIAQQWANVNRANAETERLRAQAEQLRIQNAQMQAQAAQDQQARAQANAERDQQAAAPRGPAVGYVEPVSEPAWKFYGEGKEANGDRYYVYFPANEVTHLDNGHLKVWTKELRATEVAGAGYDSLIQESARQKLRAGYMPPLATLYRYDQKDLYKVIASEEVANIVRLKPTARFFWEFDCPQKKYRGLSGVMLVDGETISDTLA